ncbi:hypothetical protein RclHR1_18210003 [Rhizophagus clarus]|uniref:RNase H type-1 domain-containing protein n=1 Tax=Rhizophagus clarus TaxID=94130 RepID=A0A2Z6QM32_9GLOM|nr:hypothetical protein RclHR1_18210003 [Rhizophagus clarus]
MVVSSILLQDMIKLASEISLTSMHNYISRILSKKQPHSVPELDGSLLQPDLNTSLLGFGECLAFLIALLDCPHRAKVTVHTNSLTMIHTFNNIFNSYLFPIKPIKVKAHSDDTLNDQADRLAHLGNSSNKCINVNSHTLPCMRGPNRHNIPLNCNKLNNIWKTKLIGNSPNSGSFTTLLITLQV